MRDSGVLWTNNYMLTLSSSSNSLASFLAAFSGFCLPPWRPDIVLFGWSLKAINSIHYQIVSKEASLQNTKISLYLKNTDRHYSEKYLSGSQICKDVQNRNSNQDAGGDGGREVCSPPVTSQQLYQTLPPMQIVQIHNTHNTALSSCRDTKLNF